MRRVKIYLMLLSILLITGCSSLKLVYQDDISYLDGLVAEHEYTLALRFIDRHNKKSPNYSTIIKRRPQILTGQKRYEQESLRQADKLVASEQWAEAIELLEEAVDKIPSSKPLIQKLTNIKDDRDDELDQIRYQIALHEAQMLKGDRELYTRFYSLDRSIATTPEIIDRRAKAIADNLMQWATRFVMEKETIKARNTLKLAGEVVPEIRNTAPFRTNLRRIEEIERDISKAIKKKREIEQQQQIKEFNELYEQGDLVEAQIILGRIEQKFGHTKTIRKLRQRLDQTVTRKINEHMASGMFFYSKEQVEYAINEWGYVLLLDPDHQDALENISRAVKVLEQLQKVRKNQQR